MLKKSYKAYVYFFWRLSRWLQSDFDLSEKWSEWKALTAVCVLEGYILLGIAFTLELFIFGKNNLLPFNPISLFAPAAIALVILNRWLLLNASGVQNLKQEFESYARRANLIGGVAVAGTVVVILLIMTTILYHGSKAI